MSDNQDMNGWQVAGMMVGIMLTMFIMVYGAQIFAKVKTEKCNRIMEVLATCVPGKTMMLAKLISVGLIGLTQIMIWTLMVATAALVIFTATGIAIDLSLLADWRIYTSVLWGLVYFVAGYIFYGSMFAAIGAMTDKNQENQEYMTVLTFILFFSFYIGQFSVDNASSSIATWCSFIPFTAATVGPIGTIGGQFPLWHSLLSIAVLAGCGILVLTISGKIYTSTLLLKGKKLSPRDIVTFIKSR